MTLYITLPMEHVDGLVRHGHVREGGVLKVGPPGPKVLQALRHDGRVVHGERLDPPRKIINYCRVHTEAIIDSSWTPISNVWILCYSRRFYQFSY